ncbi:MAG: methyltransferase family protein [Candidatus Ranarchaeia archaeon]|jgi:protein-S-isoprenylcysteine O-methyltransferase Ste14
MLEYLIVVLGVVIFGVQHSGLSALPVKHRIIDRWGKEGYSKIYSITSVLTLGVAFLMLNFWDWLYFIFSPETLNLPLFAVGVIFGVFGGLLTLKASRIIDVSTVADMRSDRAPELITTNLYARIRHPLYLAAILVLIGLVMLYPFSRIVIFSISLIGYVLVGAYLEEQKLIKVYGDKYLEYKKHAGFMLPKWTSNTTKEKR